MSKFKKVTREEKIQKLVETQDVHCDIQITLKWLYSRETWIGGQCLKSKTWDMKGFKIDMMSF